MVLCITDWPAVEAALWLIPITEGAVVVLVAVQAVLRLKMVLFTVLYTPPVFPCARMPRIVLPVEVPEEERLAMVLPLMVCTAVANEAVPKIPSNELLVEFVMLFNVVALPIVLPVIV